MPPRNGSPLNSGPSSRHCRPRSIQPPPTRHAPSTTTTPPNPAQSREAASQLTTLLSELDPGAADFVETQSRGAASAVR